MMSENDPSVRRVGRQDRKERLEPVSPDFSAHETEPPSQALPDEETPDFLALIPDDPSDDGLELLANLPPRVLRPNAITPAEERFPPIAPPPSAPKPRAPVRAAAKPKPEPKPKRAGLYNAITGLALLATLAWVVIFGIIWVQPQSPLNPFPPAPEFIFVTATPGFAEPTLVATIAPAPIVIDSAGYPFAMTDTVLYAPNGNGLGCAWGSIAGSVTARDGSPLNGYRIRIVGNGLDEVAFSGAALTFGPGGYEMPLGSVPQAQEYTVQLLSPQSAPLSPAYPVTTQATCEQNVAVVNFREAQ